MKTLYIVLFIFIDLSFLPGFSQDTSPEIDSLISVLKSCSEKNRFDVLTRISDGYLNYSLDKSREYAIQSLDFAKRIKDKNKIATSDKKLGIIEYYAGNLEKGLQYFDESLKLYEELKDKKQICNVTNNIGLMQADLGNNQEAIKYYEKSMELDKELGDSTGVGLTIGNLATIYLNIGDYEKALKLYNQSLNIAKNSKDNPRIVSNLCNIGLVYHTWGKYTTAVTYYLDALKESEKENDPKVKAQILLNLGVIYYDWKNYNKALEYYKEAYEIQNSVKSYVDAAKTLMDIGVLYDKWGKDELAMDAYQKSLKICRGTENKYETAMILFNLATFYDTRNKSIEGLKYLKEALQIRKEIEDNRGIASCLNSMGNIYMKQDDYSEALSCFEESEKILKSVESMDLMMNNLLNFSDLYYDMGDYKKSRDYLYKYGVLRDSTFSANTQKELANLQTRYETDKKEKEIQLLNKDNELRQMEIKKKNEEMKKQRILIYSFVFGFIIILVFSVFLYRLYMQKKKANILLFEKNAQILQQNEEITAQRDEIEAQRDEIEAQRDHAEQQRDMIGHQKMEIESSIHYAKRIQTAVLPTKEIINQSVQDYFILFYPRDIVSGDFYWASRKCDQLVVAAADCTGHGVPGAFMSMLGVSFLNEIVNRLASSGTLDASEILNQLRNQIIFSLHQTGKEGGSKDGMDISLIILDMVPQNNSVSKSFKLQYAGANNPIYIVRQVKSLKVENADVILDELKPDKMPVGVHERQDISFTKKEIIIPEGSQIYLFSDGYADQFGGPKSSAGGKKFKYLQLKEKLLEWKDQSMEVQKENLDKTFQNWKGNLDQTDDVLLIGLKV